MQAAEAVTTQGPCTAMAFDASHEVLHEHADAEESEPSQGILRQQQAEGSLKGESTAAADRAAEGETEAGEEGKEEEGSESDADSDCEDAATAESDKLAALDAAAVFALGKAAFKQHEFAKAADLFSRAVEKQLSDTGCSELDPCMGVFYLWFGDALLSKEESTEDMLAQLPQAAAAQPDSAGVSGSQSSSASSGSTEQKEGVDTPDDELAFQMFELAKKCLANKLNYTSPTEAADGSKAAAVQEATRVLDRKEVVEAATDLSFACLRLGDLQLMNSRFQDATQDYGEAVAVRRAFNLGEAGLLAPSISLAQSVFFSGDTTKALTLFKECEALAVRIREGLLPLPQGTSLKAVSDTAEDLAIQIADIEQQQGQQQKKAPGSQCEAKNLIPSTTSSFDAPVLACKDHLHAPMRVTRAKPKEATAAAARALDRLKPLIELLKKSL
ncbi:tetratricopeptide repeat-containing protein [Cyclospora cayetanensis]|uniref:Tetratricopeptide repeat-containing protein n=1 Tax=Cyclospora cayetanensis TaxID=88456 RepID=A0A1D3CWW1_9EIME|nr:tetratricopeptide repeat-containing protein [Cyclospora cayetanensis]